jgi:outer membrane protein assembly factor BamD
MNFRSSFSMRPAMLLALASGLTLPGFTMQAQAVSGQATQTTDAQGAPQTDLSVTTSSKKKVAKADRVQQSKATKKEVKKEDKYNPLIAKDQTLPDKQLYDKALAQQKSGHYDVARLDLQTLMNTYPDSQYLMRAKLAVADSWYREGGAAELAQAEQEYKDFITFFPNAPEAAEAQMRVGDIYFKQMDVPDRDYSKAINAETEYRTMLKQYPDAPPNILKEASQKLREVQEVLATREAGIAAFYGTHANWPAAIARYQTVVDTYPLYSHMDDVLIGVGDAYEAEAKAVRDRPVCAAGVLVPCLPEGAKSKLEQDFDNKAVDAYRSVVLKHSAAAHVEDAKDRLQAMDLPIPTPTAQDRAASEELEGSRAQYTMRSRMELLLMHKPDTVTAAQKGDPPLEDAPATTAPTIVTDLQNEFVAALNPNAAKPEGEKAVAPAEAGTLATPAPAPASNAPLALSDVPAAGGANDSGAPTEMAPAAGDTGGGASTGIGSSIISTGGTNVPVSTLPAATGAPDPNYGVPAAAPKDNTSLPAAEAPAAAPDQVNEADGKQTVPAAANKPDKSGKAPDYDKGDESSSKHKPKKGLDKLNPF